MDALNLPAYLRRIGHAGPVGAPDLETLSTLIAAHRSAISFENIGGFTDQPPQLGLGALQHKLVERRRGGYCFEQNNLFLAVLRQLGFRVDGLEGRVRVGPVTHDVETARSHMALRVTLDGIAYLVDVGFGGLAPAGPLVLAERATQVRHGERYAIADIERDGEPGWVLRGVTDGQWHDFYRLHTRSVPPIDYEMANWFVATNPGVMLKNNLIVSRPLPDGTRVALLNDRLTTRRRGVEPPERRVLGNRGEFADAFADLFDLTVAPADLDAVMSALERAKGEVRMSGLS